MTLLADALLAIGAFGVGMYCLILSKRLKDFRSLEKGVGGAVAILSRQVSELEKTTSAATKAAKSSQEKLTELTIRAEKVSNRIDLQMASLMDQEAEADLQKDTLASSLDKQPLFTRRAQE